MKESYSYSRNRMKIANRGAGMSFLPKENSTFRIECWRNDLPPKKRNHPTSGPLRDKNLLGI